MFLTGTGARIVSVGTLDAEPIGEADSWPVTRRLEAAFARFVEDRGTPL